MLAALLGVTATVVAQAPAAADTAPSVPTAPAVSPAPVGGTPGDTCGAQAPYPYLGRGDYTLGATTGPGEETSIEFQLQAADGTVVTDRSTVTMPPGSHMSTGIETSTLTDGATYGWRVRGSDGRGVVSDWSAPCHFTVITSDPAPPTITSADFPPVGSPRPEPVAPATGTFTLHGSPDVVAYRYAFDDELPASGGSSLPADANGDATLPLSDVQWGSHTLIVEALNRGGNGSESGYRFYVPWQSPALPDTPPGSLVTINSANQLTTHLASTGGTFTSKRADGTWAKGTVAVPAGDFGGGDTLIRTPAGQLSLYEPADGAVFTPASPAVPLGGGWSQYKWLGDAGYLYDVTNPDLVAWSVSTGDLYVMPWTGAGFGPRVLVHAGLTYVRLIAVGDVTGDGFGDLLAYDHEHNLWLMPGNGHGGFSARQPVFTDWGAGYDAMAATGDLTGDGHPDLVERGADGTVWVNPGDGHGHFGARVKAATGWQGYVGLF